MADQSDVINAFIASIAASVYPNGTSQASIVTAPVRIFGGWPLPENLDSDLAAGTCNISVYPRPEEQDTSRLGFPILSGTQNATGTTLVLADFNATFGGTPIVGETLGLTIDDAPFAYAVQAGDTPTSIAATFAALSGGFASGPTITYYGSHSIVGAVEGKWPIQQEVGRIDKLFQITVWAPKFDIRDALAKAIEPGLRMNFRLDLGNGLQATTRYVRSQQSDDVQKAQCYVRHLFFYAEYPITTPLVTVPAVSATLVMNVQPAAATGPYLNPDILQPLSNFVNVDGLPDI